MERLAIAPPDAAEDLIRGLSEQAVKAMAWDWGLWARPDQLPPEGDWLVWLLLAGRGSGKTRAGSEWMRRRGPQGREGVLIGANPRDVRDLMIEGRSGILAVSPHWERPKYEPSKLLLTWPNGAKAHVRSAEDPEGLRGLSLDWAWGDEPAKWRYLKETWDNLRFAMREGIRPQTCLTTTPKPLQLIKDLVAGRIPGTVVAKRVSTFRNRAHLAASFLAEMAQTYLGTTLGRQELDAEILADIEGALWNWRLIERTRWQGAWLETPVGHVPALPEFTRTLVAVDPSGSKRGAETGIVAVATDSARPARGYVLGDYSLRGSPATWAAAAIRAYCETGAELIVAEVNYGGEMVENTIRTVPAIGPYPSGEMVPFKMLHAQRTKELRAEPVVGLYEQDRITHVGAFPELETQMTSWVPPGRPNASKESPDRVDALVHGLTELLVAHPYRDDADWSPEVLVGSNLWGAQ